MSLSENFKQEYFELLRSCALLIAELNQVEELFFRYQSLKEKANKILKNINSVCSNVEDLIDSNTYKLKPSAMLIIEEYAPLKATVYEFLPVFAKCQELKKSGCDSLTFSGKFLIAKSNYENYEKQIIATFGKDEGRKIIYEQKKKATEFEKTLGIYFFADQVLRLKQLFKTQVLYAQKEQLDFTEEDNITSQFLTLENDFGDKISVEKSGQFVYRSCVYLEIIFTEELKIRSLNYYKIEELQDRYKLTLEEDETIFNDLWALQEQVEIAQNKKKKT